MRSRSATVYAKQSPLKAPETQSTTITTPTPKPAAKLSQADVSRLFEDFGPLCEPKCFKDNFSGDFNSSSSDNNDNTGSTASNSLTAIRSRAESDHSSGDPLFEDEVKCSKMVRGMVIGSQGVDRLQIVNTMYPAEGDQVVQQKFDLVTRRVEKEAVTEKYQFWVKEAGSERRHAALYNVYYKTCSVIFLVYNEEDRATFECLEHEIQMIKEANQGKEVLLVLCANKGTDNKCEVSEEEVKEMKEKYGIKLALESNIASEELREKLSGLAK